MRSCLAELEGGGPVIMPVPPLLVITDRKLSPLPLPALLLPLLRRSPSLT